MMTLIVALLVVVAASCVVTATFAPRLVRIRAWGQELTGYPAYGLLFAMVTVTLVVAPIWLPVGALLHVAGRRGFWTVEADDNISLHFERASFARTVSS